jgi:hypothetical protein
VDVLQDFVNAYNNSFHRSIDTAPSNVTYDMEQDLWQKLYGDLAKHRKYKFNLGDNVHISQSKLPFTKEYEEKFTGEIFVITRRTHNGTYPLYKLKDLMDEPITGTFYEWELSPVSIGADRTYKIAKILRRRTNKGQKQVLVKWKYYPEKFNSWIPASDVKRYEACSELPSIYNES